VKSEKLKAQRIAKAEGEKLKAKGEKLKAQRVKKRVEAKAYPKESYL
jgi:hypothetical protein